MKRSADEDIIAPAPKANRHKLCKSEFCTTQARMKHYEGYCHWCFVHMFPNSPALGETKETSVFTFLKQQFPTAPWLRNVPIPGGSSRRRPDIMVKLSDKVLIVEVDEYQHAHYDTTCEVARVNDLTLDAGCPVVIIHFNPDKYRGPQGEVTSCWTMRSKLCVGKKKEWAHRLDSLRACVDKWMTQSTDEPATIERLFFDVAHA